MTVSNSSPSAPDPDEKRLAEVFWRVESLLLRGAGAGHQTAETTAGISRRENHLQRGAELGSVRPGTPKIT